MQWIGPFEGDWRKDVNEDFPAGSPPPPMVRQVRMAWVQSLIESGDYDGGELLNQVIDEMLVEKFFSE